MFKTIPRGILFFIAIGTCMMLMISIIGFCFAIGAEQNSTANDIPQTTLKTTTITTPKPTPVYDVPLNEDLQIYIIKQCNKHNIDPAVVIAMIWRESNYSADAVGDNGNSVGLMQIQERHHSERMTKLGCTNLYNPYDNVTVGIDILSGLITKYDGNVEMALIAYNAGPTGAHRNWFSQGIYTNKYSQAVLKKSQELYS